MAMVPRMYGSSRILFTTLEVPKNNMQDLRCGWSTGDPLYMEYHDEEWGVPIRDDQKMFEFLVLESFQAGLSWITILRKRENFREAFDSFDAQKIAAYDAAKIDTLMLNSGIIRNRKKIEATVNNAQKFLEIQQKEGSFSDYLWSFQSGEPLVNHWESLDEVPAKTELSEKISKVLKKEGFKFLGPTTIYAHMQASGMVNDHVVTCPRHRAVQNK